MLGYTIRQYEYYLCNKDIKSTQTVRVKKIEIINNNFFITLRLFFKKKKNALLRSKIKFCDDKKKKKEKKVNGLTGFKFPSFIRYNSSNPIYFFSCYQCDFISVNFK